MPWDMLAAGYIPDVRGLIIVLVIRQLAVSGTHYFIGSESQRQLGVGGDVLRAKDPKVRRAWVCKTVAGLVLLGIAGNDHWP